MAKANNDAAGATGATDELDLVEVRLLRGYSPIYGARYEDRESLQGNQVVVSRIFEKRWPGEVLQLPREEARRALKLGIATIDGDLI
jgi:hypothetical protein